MNDILYSKIIIIILYQVSNNDNGDSTELTAYLAIDYSLTQNYMDHFTMEKHLFESGMQLIFKTTSV